MSRGSLSRRLPLAMAGVAAIAVLIALLVARKAAKPVTEALNALGPPPVPELRLRGSQKGHAQADSSKCRQALGSKTHSHCFPPG